MGSFFRASGTVPAASIGDAELASPNNVAYKHLMHGSGAIVDNTASATWHLTTNYYYVLGAASWGLTYLNPADFAVAGLTTKYMIRSHCGTNTVDPVSNFTVGLYPVTASAGAADASTVTTGAVTSGSTAVHTAPGASALVNATSGAFTAPAAGYYFLGVVNSATTANNSLAGLSADLYVNNV